MERILIKESPMVTTLSELLLHSLKSFPKDEFMLVKKDERFVPLSAAEFGRTVEHLSLGLGELGLGTGDKMIILSENRPEWTMADFACICRGGITVPIYTTLTPRQVQYIINDSDAKIVIISDEVQWAKIAEVRADLPRVKHFVSLAPTSAEGVLTLAQVVERGSRVASRDAGAFSSRARALKPDDEASIIYTSGTTGVPKGVILTHKNFVSNITTVATIIEFTEKDTVLSFLPLSHVLERMVMFTYIYRGCTIAFAESVDKIAQNLVEVRPTIMVSAPRVFEKMYAKVMDNVLASSKLKRKIFFWGVKVGKAWGVRTMAKQKVGSWLGFKRRLAHKLVYSKVIEKTGGRVRFFVSGGAPLAKDIAEFFYALGIVILEGYGLTETAPVVAVNTFERMKFGTVGPPMPGVEVKIAADGEILVRGPNVMKGYYKKPAETDEVFENGWFKTGDIGVIDDEGFLAITDRKKDLIITAGGKNIAPQPIENILKTNPYIGNAAVIGDRRRFISALIVPNFEKLEDYARTNKIPFVDRAELVKNARVVNFLKSEIDRATPDLASYERIKKIAVLPRDFEIAEDEMTPSLKIRRNIVQEKYKAIIDAMYWEDNG
jgi:long-chain acyl-CoA synthetase